MAVDYENLTMPSHVAFACQMTLRQWYAGQALAGLASEYESAPNTAARLAFELADAMIRSEAKDVMPH